MNVLFLCTGNSARSVIAESLMTHLGEPRHRGFSAGSHPVGRINPGAERVLTRHGIHIDGLRSKSWDEFAGTGAVAMDAIVTVCDNAAGETCPIWPGHPASAHWGLPDPAAVSGQITEVDAAFEATYAVLSARIAALIRWLDEPRSPAALTEQLAHLATLR